MPILEITQDGEVTKVRLPNETMRNKYGVPKSVWGKWSPEACIMFNTIADVMSTNQWIFLHPEAKEMPREHWKTVWWNAAWHAAEARG